MRIICGTHKGRRLIAPNTLPVRPTSDRAKEAIFNILSNRYLFENKKVLDLFSGTGNIAYEFKSRGCEEVIAIDKNANCINYIEKTCDELELNIKAVKSDCIKYLKNSKKKYNIIFADPPYKYDKHQELKEIIFEKKLITKDGILIIEHSKETTFQSTNIEHRKYGNVHFSIFSF